MKTEEKPAPEAKGERVVPVRPKKDRYTAINKECWDSRSAVLHSIQHLGCCGLGWRKVATEANIATIK